MTRAVFLDRDGTLNPLVYYADTQEYESPRTAQALILLPDILPALQLLAVNGYQLFLVSNQPSYAKGKTSLGNLEGVHRKLVDQLTAADVQLTEAYYCYHHPKGVIPAYTMVCDCRKPAIGSLLKAQDSFSINLKESWMIGDQVSDVSCGQNAGCRTILLDYAPSTNKRNITPELQPDARHDSLLEAANWLIQQS
ncbi:MAG: HAD-IIIA family hydrolase [Anaerolineae bacterium]|nr:HAD-IIIA family hydrolase [Anaerolineae bacterium]